MIYLSEDQSRRGDTYLDQKNKKFSPLVVLAGPSSTLWVRNSDDVDHNVYADDRSAAVKFDIGLRAPGTQAPVKVTWPQGAIITLRCKIHPKMRAWLVPVSSQYAQWYFFSPKNRKYLFSLEDWPEKFTWVKVLIPGYEPISKQVKPGETIQLDLVRRGRIKGTVTFSRP